MIHATLDTVPVNLEKTMGTCLPEQTLLQENVFLRSLVAELLIKNQKLRSALATSS